MNNNYLNIPEAVPLPNTDVNLPLAFVADEIFKMNNHLLKPYSRRRVLTYEQKIFNYRLKRARLTIECAFGILTSRYRVLRDSLKFDVGTSKLIVASTVCLHNYILTTSAAQVDNEDLNHLNHVYHLGERMAPLVQRNLLSQYFTSPVGAVHWQDECI